MSGDLSTSFPFVAGTRVPVDIGSHQLWMTVFLELGVEEAVAIPSNDTFQEIRRRDRRGSSSREKFTYRTKRGHQQKTKTLRSLREPFYEPCFFTKSYTSTLPLAA